MTDPVQPRPQPVVDLASFGANIVVVVGGLAFIVDGIATATHWTWAISCGAGLTGAAAFLAKYVPKLAAIGAAAQVTPLSDPRDHQLRPLKTEPYIGKHRAPEGGYIDEGPSDDFSADGESDIRGHWYDLGTGWSPGVTLTYNATGKPIPVVRRTDTQEIPRVTARRLGRKPPTNAPRIKLTASMVPAAAFTPPPSVDWYSKVPAQTWSMDGNDGAGDCTLAEVDHSTKARQVAAGNPEVRSTVDEVLGAYSAITGYDPTKTRPDGSNPTDQGAVMQDVRDYWRKNGITLGGKLDKLTLFAEVDHTDLNLIRWCVARFGAVALGINFPASAMDQFDAGQPWDVVRGATIEGGHAISMIGYDAQYAYVVTWGKVQPMTWAFFQTYVEEAWTDVSADWINASSGQDPLGEVAYALGEQFAQVTGKPNPFPAPAPTPEPPAPTPGPAPTPAPSLPPASVAALMARILRRKGSPKEDVTAANDFDEWLAEQ